MVMYRVLQVPRSGYTHCINGTLRKGPHANVFIPGNALK